MPQTNFSSASEDTVGASQPFTASIDVPAGYGHSESVTPKLLYPIEVAAIADWNVPQGDDEWPELDSIPESGTLLWILQGDVGYDYEAMPAQGDWFVPSAYAYLNASSEAPSGRPSPGTPEVVEAERAISGVDRAASPWTGCNTWARLVPLTDSNGDTPERPAYLVIYVFTGSAEPSLQPASEMVESLTVHYS